MLTKDQKMLLAQLVRENKDILLKKFGAPGVTKRRKEQVWEAIRHELIDAGAELTNLKTLRDTEWNNLRRAAIKRFFESQKYGSCLSQMDEIIMDAVGRDIQPATTKPDGSDSGDCDYSKYLTVECDPIVVHPNMCTDDDGSTNNQMDFVDHVKQESHVNGAQKFDQSSQPSTSSDAKKSMGILRGDQIVPPSHARQQLGLKRKRVDDGQNHLQEVEQQNFQDFDGGSDQYMMPDQVDFEKLELEKELLRHEIELRKAQIQESRSRTNYYNAAVKALQDKKHLPLKPELML